MINNVDIETPLFILIDEVKKGSLTKRDLTKEQLKSLPESIRKIAESNK